MEKKKVMVLVWMIIYENYNILLIFYNMLCNGDIFYVFFDMIDFICIIKGKIIKIK